MVEFYIDGVKKGEKPVQIPAGGQVDVNFPTPPTLKAGELHRAEIVLKGTPDPLEDDDRRYVTFKIRPPLKVLVIADRDADAQFVAAALDYDSSPSTPKSYLVKTIRSPAFGSLDRNSLESFACVFLLNVERLDRDRLG